MLANAHNACICVKRSPIHGKGVFAVSPIPAETCIMEYVGARISPDEAAKRTGRDPANPYHTFFFGLPDGTMIDGGDNGNDARWINHSCEPNCEAREDKGRIFIVALRDIEPGEELKYDYRIDLPDEQTASLKKSYECRCGSKNCRSTMLGDGPSVFTKDFILLQEHGGVVLNVYEPTGSAATLATVLHFQHDIATDEREVASRLAEQLELQERPSAPPSFLVMKRVALAYGLNAAGYHELSLAQLMDLAPAIIQIELKASMHFSVFRGVIDAHAVLADPSYGNIAMPLKTFNRAWQKRAALVI